ncbi:hypothetical protein L7F22_057762 [Adiantum nelumboides]|nr:hypothetical protein [Adiantum nelumboides]
MANMAFPTFHGRSDEDATDFMDNLEVACVVFGRDDDVSRLRLFSLLLKAEARTWFNTLLPVDRADWGGLRMAFMQRFGARETSKKLWERLCELRLVNVFEYGEYELQFTDLWDKWIATLAIGKRAPDFLKRDCFVAGLCPPLKDKVKARVMTTAEKDYTAMEHMVMALMFAVRKFRPYLLPKKFIILTLEENFPLILQHMDVSARISKWLVRLQEFEYTVQVENSTRASLAGLLTHRCYEKKLKVKPTMVKVEEEVSKLGEAHSLYVDGAYKRKVDKAAVGVVIYDEEGRKVFGKGLMFENVHSNHEAEYVALSLGLEWCLNLGIKRLNAFGDALLLVKQVHGTWACRNQGLVVRLRRVKELLKRFEVAHLLHVPRKDNQEADTLASEKLQDVIIGAVALQQPQFQGSDCMPDILHFLEIGECLEGLSKGERQWLVFVVGISHMTLPVGKYFKQDFWLETTELVSFRSGYWLALSLEQQFWFCLRSLVLFYNCNWNNSSDSVSDLVSVTGWLCSADLVSVTGHWSASATGSLLPALSPAPWVSCPLKLESFRAPKQSQTCKNQQPGCAEIAPVWLYEQFMEDNGIQDRDAVDGFHLIVVLELRTRIVELQAQQGTDLGIAKRGFHEEIIDFITWKRQIPRRDNPVANMLSRAKFEDEEEMLTISDDVGLKFHSSSHLHACCDTLVRVYEVFFEEIYDGDWLLIGRYLSTLTRQEGWSDQEYKRFKKKAYGYFLKDGHL